MECKGIILADYTFTSDEFPNGTEAEVSYSLQAIPDYPLSAYHYDSLEKAADDINNGTLGASAMENGRGACVALFTQDDTCHCRILQNLEEVSVKVEKSCIFEIGGYTLSAKEDLPLLEVEAGCTLVGSSSGIGTREKPYLFINTAPGASIVMEDCAVNVVDNSGGTVTNFCYSFPKISNISPNLV